MSYDTKCYDLAETFLSDEGPIDPKQADELADLIQRTIEDYLQFGRKRPALSPASKRN